MSLNDIAKFGRYIFFFMFFLMSSVTMLLIYEYRYFKSKVAQLELLKEDYTTYLLTLKKLVSEYDKTKIEQEIVNLEEKKKITNLDVFESSDTCKSGDLFPIVNREPEYLLRESLAFAKLHNLEVALSKIYEAQELVAQSYKVRTRKTRNTRRNNISSPIVSQIQEQFESVSSKRESIFIWPINRNNFWLSAFFGPRKISGVWKFHKGIDMAAVKGTPVLSAGAGVITEARYVSGYGNTILITHDKKFKTRYAHLSKILVKVGEKVEQGDIIGKVGDTGFVKGRNGFHLHFEVYVYSKQVNPFYFLIK